MKMVMKLWNELSTQGKIYTICQSIYFILILIGLRILIQIRNKL